MAVLPDKIPEPIDNPATVVKRWPRLVTARANFYR
jgi:hypothetical protein